MVTTTPDEIKEILKKVKDPEIPAITIDDLGILQDVQVVNSKIIIHIIPTYSGCPAMDMITVNIKSVLQERGYDDVEVILSLSPAWSTSMIGPEAREKLRSYGIAPPVEGMSKKAWLEGKVAVECPLCNSGNTEMISQFGSTACKALYRCKDCKEPFDYFKCL